MVSAYAQSGKLFEELRSSRIHNVPQRFQKQFGAMAANQKTIAADQSDGRASHHQVKAEDNEVQWLNRVAPRAPTNPNVMARPRTIECMDDIQMSQMTDDCSTQHSGSQGCKITNNIPSAAPPHQQPFVAISNHQLNARSRFHYSAMATPIKTPPVTSRFHHLTLPSLRNPETVSTPRASVSVASSRTPYQQRNKNSNVSRPWTQGFAPVTPFRYVRSSNQKPHSTQMVSLTTPTSQDIQPLGSTTSEAGRFSFSRLREEDASNQSSCVAASAARASLASRQFATLQTSSEKLIKEQMKKLEEKAASINEILAEKIAESKRTAITEMVQIKKTFANELDETGKKAMRQLEEGASEIRQANEHEAKGFFQSQRTHLIETCLPFLHQTATSMISDILKGPSFFTMVETALKSMKFLGKSELGLLHSTSEPKSKAAVTKVRTARKVSSANKTKHRKPALDSIPTRRSKRKASKNNPFCPPIRARPVVVPKNNRIDLEAKTKDLPQRGKNSRKSQEHSSLTEPTTSPRHITTPLATTVVSVVECVQEYRGYPKDPEKDSEEQSGLTNESLSFTTEWSTPRKRKRIFGRSVDTDLGVTVSPEVRFLSNRKQARGAGITKKKDEVAAPVLKMKAPIIKNSPMTPRMPFVRRKPDFLSKNLVHKRGPVLIEDIFEFNF